MPLQLFEPFSTDSRWLEIADHANRLLREYGYYNYEILIQPAAGEKPSESKNGDRCEVEVQFYRDECRLDLFIADPRTNTEASSILDLVTPEEFARDTIIDILDQFLNGSDPDQSASFSGRRFRVIDGGKKA